jgi:hypothetical protein
LYSGTTEQPLRRAGLFFSFEPDMFQKGRCGLHV